MRWIVMGIGLALVGLHAQTVLAEDEDSKKSERIIGGVISGLLGVPGQSPESAYTTQERDRLVSFLQSGEYATSRQGEPVDLMVYGVPLTRLDHVYTAKPVAPSQTSYRKEPER